MLLLNLLFGKRLLLNDDDLGKFYSDKKLKHGDSIICKSNNFSINKNCKTYIILEDSSPTFIHSDIKDLLKHFKANLKSNEEKIKSLFPNLNNITSIQYYIIEGTLKKGQAELFIELAVFQKENELLEVNIELLYKNNILEKYIQSK